MASSKISKTLVKSLKGRAFSAAAQPAKVTQPKGSHLSELTSNCTIKSLSNGMKIGVINTKSPVSRIAVVANAGSRFEDGDSMGVSHLLRFTGKLGTEEYSNLWLVRNAQHIGGDVSITGTREYIYYKCNVTRNCTDEAVEILKAISTKQLFRFWELERLHENSSCMPLDMALYKQKPLVRAIEMLHSAAFRTGLGNSLYCPDYMVGKHTSEQLKDYVKKNFIAGRLALIGIGVDEANLEQLALEFEPHRSEGNDVKKSTYYGGAEQRHMSEGNLAYVATGFGAPSLNDKELLPAEVLRHILGSGPRIKYSAGASPLLKPDPTSDAHVSALNASYTDGGIFGFTAVAHSSQIEKALKTAAEKLMSIPSNLQEADLARGKTQLKAELCRHFYETPDGLLDWLGEQALNSEEAINPEHCIKMVDDISISDVKEVAKTILSTKPSMAVTGNTANVPYLDQLFS